MSSMKIYMIHAVTPIHVGSGRGVGFIDLPVMREKVTNWPIIPGTSFKGVLSERFDASPEKRGSDPKLKAAFGLTNDDGDMSNSGSLVFTDARVVCLPVRSIYGTFAWVTSPAVLRRLKNDIEWARAATGTHEAPDIPAVDKAQSLLYSAEAGTVLKNNDGNAYLEDLDLKADGDELADSWAQKIAGWVFGVDVSYFKERFAIIHDDVFNFLSETGTVVTPRVRISSEQKTVVGGALWYEEALPVETIMAGLVWCDKVYQGIGNGITPDALMQEYCTDSQKLQIGGKATVGRGLVNCVFA